MGVDHGYNCPISKYTIGLWIVPYAMIKLKNTVM